MQTDARHTRMPRERGALTRDDLDRCRAVTSISPGRWANANVRVVEESGAQWVVKDFRLRPFIVRNTIGRLLIMREVKGLQRLAGLEGVPGHAFRVDAHAIAYRFVPGTPLGIVPTTCLNTAFFSALEALLSAIHARGVVHLDVRNANNILMTTDGRPALIDFQSHIGTARFPAAVRRWLEQFDMAGVYKHWARHDPESLGANRTAELAVMNRWRKFWFLRGYLGARKRSSRPRAAGRTV